MWLPAAQRSAAGFVDFGTVTSARWLALTSADAVHRFAAGGGGAASAYADRVAGIALAFGGLVVTEQFTREIAARTKAGGAVAVVGARLATFASAAACAKTMSASWHPEFGVEERTLGGLAPRTPALVRVAQDGARLFAVGAASAHLVFATPAIRVRFTR